MRADITVDLDDVEVSAEISKVGGGSYQSWHMTFRFAGSEVSFEAGDSADIEALLDSLQHDLMLLKSGATRTVDGRVSRLVTR